MLAGAAFAVSSVDALTERGGRRRKYVEQNDSPPSLNLYVPLLFVIHNKKLVVLKSDIKSLFDKIAKTSQG